MKRIVFYSVMFVLFTACEEVPPHIDFSPPYKTKDTTYIISTIPPAQHKAVLIEDITGVRCVNCPQAAQKAKDIQSAKTDDSVVVLALYTNHLPSFTTPWPGVPLLNTSISTDIVGSLGVPGGLPSGYVDRYAFPPQPERYNAYQVWGNLVNIRLKQATPVNIELGKSLNGRLLTVSLKLQYTTAVTGTKHKYCLYLIEDGIVSTQSTTTGADIYYVHNHALRYSFGNSVGNALDSSLVAGRTFKKLLDYTIPSENVINNCRLVCVVVDAYTGEAINVRELALK